MASVSSVLFRKAMRKSANSLRNLAFPAVNLRFIVARNSFLRQVRNHPVSQELLGGADAPNISGTLSGLRGPGHNLFSFIGFSAGESPVDDLLLYLRNSIQLHRNQEKLKTTRLSLIFSYPVTIPFAQDVYNNTPMPSRWNPGRSWVRGIERGNISGLAYYLYWKKGLPQSKSGGGIQTKNRLRELTSPTKQPYITPLLNELRVKVIS